MYSVRERQPWMHQHRAGIRPCPARGRNSCTTTQPAADRQPMVPGFRHEAGGAIRPRAFRLRTGAFGLGVRQNSSNAARPPMPRRYVLGGAEQAADDLDAD